ncbi:MAG: amidohydrolase family protein [Pseudomonadota bacterium]
MRKMRAANLTVGVGTDGANCADNQNMFEAMRLASFASKVRGPDHETWLTTDEVLSMATEGSARALASRASSAGWRRAISPTSCSSTAGT